MIGNTAFDGAFGSLWIALLLLAMIAVLMTRRSSLYGGRIRPGMVVGLALIARLVPTLVLNAGLTVDIQTFALIANLTRTGHDVYSGLAVGHYPYLPGQLWFSLLSLDLHDLLHGAIPFVVLVKVTPALADAGVAVVLMAGLRRRGYARHVAVWAGCLYACNPISVLIIAYQGQFHGVPVFLCVVAWWLCEERNNTVTTRAPRLVGAGLALGTAILTKSWPALLVPAFLIAVRRPRAALLLSACGAGVLVLATLPYAVALHVPLQEIVRTVLGYTSSPGAWGLGAITAWLHGRAHLLSLSGITALFHVSQVVVIALAIVLPFRHRRRPLAHTLLLAILCMYVFSTNFNTQYLMWAVPFTVVLLVDEEATGAGVSFLILATLGLAVTYLGSGWVYATLPSPAMIGKGWQVALYPLWLTCVWWFIQEVCPLWPLRIVASAVDLSPHLLLQVGALQRRESRGRADPGDPDVPPRS